MHLSLKESRGRVRCFPTLNAKGAFRMGHRFSAGAELLFLWSRLRLRCGRLCGLGFGRSRWFWCGLRG